MISSSKWWRVTQIKLVKKICKLFAYNPLFHFCRLDIYKTIYLQVLLVKSSNINMCLMKCCPPCVALVLLKNMPEEMSLSSRFCRSIWYINGKASHICMISLGLQLHGLARENQLLAIPCTPFTYIDRTIDLQQHWKAKLFKSQDACICVIWRTTISFSQGKWKVLTLACRTKF